MSNGILERLDAIEKEVFANVCRNCTRPIPGKRHLAVFDRDDDGYPRCHECAGAVKLEGFGCYVWLDDGTLYDCEINDFEAHGIDYDYYGAEVTAPESQGFLDVCNEVLGSSFSFNQFAGR